MQYRKLIFTLFLLVLLAIITGCGQGDSVTFNTSNERNAVGQVTLAWDVPTTNADGTPLTDLAGYKVYYGTSSGNYTKIIDVGNVTTYVVNNPTSGTYYFAVTAYNTQQNEGDYSDEVAKQAQ